MRAVSLEVNGGATRRQPRVVPEAPAHDLHAEREVLHSALVYPAQLDTSPLQPDDFYSAANGLIYQVLVGMRRAGVEIAEHTLRSQIIDQGLYAQVGGTDYLLDLTSGIPLTTPQTARVRRLARLRALSAAAHDLSLAARAGEDVDRQLEALARERQLLRDADAPPAPHPLARVWQTLGQWDLLGRAPAPRPWLLTRPNDVSHALAPMGVFQRGKCGLLIAEGGAGKTIALIELALAVTTGRRWLDHFHVPLPGRVLIALAEEDADEAHRRFYALADAMRLTDEQAADARRNLVVCPLAGIAARLVDPDGARTDFHAELTARLAQGGPWQLVILDPLSRFAGADTEKDNAAATLFIEAAESLCAAPGNPAVLIAHHTNKLSREPGSQAKAGHARGATALTDGARWACELQTRGDDGATLTVTKSNYSAVGQPLHLVRDGDRGGYLRAATSSELQSAFEAREAAKEAEATGLEAKVLRLLDDHPTGLSKARIAELLRARDRDVGRAVDALLGRAQLVEPTRYRYQLPPPPNPPQMEMP